MQEAKPNQSGIGSKNASRFEMIGIDLNLPPPGSDFDDFYGVEAVSIGGSCERTPINLGSESSSRVEMIGSDFDDSSGVEAVPVYGFSSIQDQMKSYRIFRQSGTPSRFMFCRNGSWVDFPDDVSERLKSCFSEGKSMVEVQIASACYLFDFVQMLQVDLLSGDLTPISWIYTEGLLRRTGPSTQDTSNTTVSKLISKLKSSKLSPSKVQELESIHILYMAGEVTNDFFMRQIKLITGDDILRSAIHELQDSS